MVLSKRERVIRALERDDEPDMIPIHYLGFERTSTAYQQFLESDEFKENKTFIKNSFSREDYRWAGDITELRFWNVDCHSMDPWRHRMKTKIAEGPPEYPGSYLIPTSGRIFFTIPDI